jgi:hypothetical protein
LCAYRSSLAQELGWSIAWNEGLIVGYFFDFVLVAAATLLGWTLQPAGRLLSRVLHFFLLALVVSSSLAQAVYYAFFGGKLFLWIVLQHSSDVGHLGGTIASLLESPWILLGLALQFFSLGILVSAPLKSRPGLWQSGVGLVALVALIGLQQWPQKNRRAVQKWIGTPHNVVEAQSVAYDHPLISWLGDLGPQQTFGKGRVIRIKNEDLARHRDLRIQKILDFHNGSWVGRTSKDVSEFPRPWDPLPQDWTRLLGLSVGPPNIVVLFVESWRAYEFLHPELGPEAFPGLWTLVKKHGIVMDRTYSSSWTAAQTVRGIFSALCSFQDNVLGAAVMLGQPKLKVDCLQSHLKSLGYGTQWIATAPSHYHNQALFELNHGTELIHEATAYLDSRKRSVLSVTDEEYWQGLRGFLPTLLSDKALFVHSINLGTHAPWIESAKPLMSTPIEDRLRGSEALGYLHAFRRWDQAAAPVLEQWLEDPRFRNTVFVLLGDHGVDVEYPDDWPTDEFQRTEAKFRVGYVVLSSRARPQRLTELRLQMHLAPLLLGLTRSPQLDDLRTTFLGSALGPAELSPQPWVFAEPQGVSSQATTSTVCHSRAANSCRNFDRNQDPLFDSGRALAQPPWNPQWQREVYRFLESVFVGVGRDDLKILPGTVTN